MSHRNPISAYFCKAKSLEQAERLRLAEAVCRWGQAVLYHDERGQGVLYAEAMKGLQGALGEWRKHLCQPAPPRALWRVKP